MRAPRFVLAVLLLTLAAAPASAGGKLELYGLRMDPSDHDARDFSRPGWGGGFEGVIPLPGTAQLVAAVVGLDAVNLMSNTVTLRDQLTGLRVEQRTNQTYGRFLAGGQFGSHSRGALRPYVGANLAVVWYNIHTDVVVPDDSDRQNEIKQTLRDQTKAAFGWDANVGLDVNFSDTWCLDFGVRYLEQYGVPQQLGAGSVSVQPGYFQYLVGVGFGPRLLQHAH